MTTGAIASEGREFDIPGPDGKPTGEKITLRHIHCDEFRIAKSVYIPKLTQLLGEETDDFKRAAMTLDLQRDLCAHLVAGWTLEQECSRENVKQLLIDEPQLLDWLDKITSKADLFFGKASPK